MKAYTSLKRQLWFGLLFLLMLGLSACSSLRGSDGASGKLDPNNIPDAVPKAEPRSKYGNPNSYVVHGKRYYVLKDAEGYDKTGLASWYGTKFNGQHTSSRESYDMYSMTAASPVLPIPTYVRVTNLQNGRTAIVKVNDRGPFRSNRLLDLSYAAAVKLGYANKGTAHVRVTAIDATASSPNLYFAQNTVAPSSPSQPTPPVSGKASDILNETRGKGAVTTEPVQLAAADKEDTSSPLYIQVGSYHSLASAKNMTQKIKKLPKFGQTQVAIKEANHHGSSVYRVHIGPLQDTVQSRQMVQLLAKNGFQKPMVVTS